MAKFNRDDQDRREGRSDFNRSNDERRPFYDNIKREGTDGGNRPERRERSFDRGERRNSEDRNERRPFGERRGDRPEGPRSEGFNRRPFGERRDSGFSRGPRNDRDDRPFGERRGGDNRFGDNRRFEERTNRFDKPRGEGQERRTPFRRDDAQNRFGGERRFDERRDGDRRFNRRDDRNDGPRNDGPRYDKPRNDRNDGPRNDGPRNERPRFDGPRRDEGPRNDRGRGFGARRSEGMRRDEPAWKDPERKSFRWSDDNDRRSTERPDDDRRFNRRDDAPARRGDRPERRPFGERRDERNDSPRGNRRPDRREGGFERREERNDSPRGNRREEGGRFNESSERRVGPKAPSYDLDRMKERVPAKKQRETKRESNNDGTIRLNRYIANSGICSRRDADVLIANGEIKVNGTVVTEMGYKVRPEDTVKYGNRVLNPEKMMYVLLNKPKDYITTTDDPQERHTVMELVKDATPYRIYPVGRLDRNTTGLLLLTNDGELAEKLTHPSNNIRKVYQVEIDKPMTTEDFEKIQAGVELEDGFIKPDDLSIITPDAQVIGIEIHSGRNRIVRRIFEHFGYEVTKLDRTVYAGLNKKDLPRGNWRYLTEKEVIRLKFLL